MTSEATPSPRDSTQSAKRAAARAAIDFVSAESIVGVGTGSTAAEFVRALAQEGPSIRGAVASSVSTEVLLKRAGIELVDLNDVDVLSVYVDGADRIDEQLRLIKGAGGALAREKICAASSDLFVCIADDSKWSEVGLGAVPVPVEVIPMARTFVERQLSGIGISTQLRPAFVTDNGNHILDCAITKLDDPLIIEAEIEAITGVVACGIFAARPADIVLLGSASGEVRRLG